VIRKMVEYIKMGKVGVTLLMRVSRQGGGLYLYIPKDFAEVHLIEGGDQIQVQLGDHYAPKVQPLEKEVS